MKQAALDGAGVGSNEKVAHIAAQKVGRGGNDVALCPLHVDVQEVDRLMRQDLVDRIGANLFMPNLPPDIVACRLGGHSLSAILPSALDDGKLHHAGRIGERAVNETNVIAKIHGIVSEMLPHQTDEIGRRFEGGQVGRAAAAPLCEDCTEAKPRRVRRAEFGHGERIARSCLQARQERGVFDGLGAQAVIRYRQIGDDASGQGGGPRKKIGPRFDADEIGDHAGDRQSVGCIFAKEADIASFPAAREIQRKRLARHERAAYAISFAENSVDR